MSKEDITYGKCQLNILYFQFTKFICVTYMKILCVIHYVLLSNYNKKIIIVLYAYSYMYLMS